MKKAGNFNHDASSIKEACGLKGSKIDERYEAFVDEMPDEETKFSQGVEQLVNNFNRREIAYLLVRSISIDAMGSSPLEELMELVKRNRE
jgi:hypothetical protein